MNGDDNAARAPTCHGCLHFGISYDPQAPYLCRVMGFKSKLLPCWEVQQADGRRCLAFTPKPTNAAPVRVLYKA